MDCPGEDYVLAECMGSAAASSVEIDNVDPGIEWNGSFHYGCSRLIGGKDDDIGCYDPSTPIADWVAGIWYIGWGFTGQAPGVTACTLNLSVDVMVETDPFGPPVQGGTVTFSRVDGFASSGLLSLHCADDTVTMEYKLVSAVILPTDVSAERYGFEVDNVVLQLSDENDPAAAERFGQVMEVPQAIAIGAMNGMCETRMVESAACE